LPFFLFAPVAFMSRCPVSDLSVLDWLPLADNTPSVSGLPLGFATYLRLLPALGIDRAIPVDSYSFASRTVEQLNARATFWTTYGIHQGQPAPERLLSITYRQVAAALGMPFTPAFGNEAIRRAYGDWPPHLGSSLALEVALAQQLVDVLGPQSATYFYGSVAEGAYRWDAEGLPTDWLEQGRAQEVVALYQQERRWPTYTFAADQSWCLYQGEDNEWLALGCSAEMAQTLRTQTTLESLPLV
jgi:hypothetical protein